MKKIITIMFLLVFLLSVNQIYAQTGSEQSEPNGPRSFSIGLTTLKEHGFGGVIRGRFNHFAIDASVGSMPWLIMYQYSDGTSETEFDMSFHSDLSAVIFFNGDQSRFQNGIRLGGAYDSIGGKALLMGWTGELTFTNFALCFGVGLQYYPDLIEKINDHFPKSRRADLDSSYKYQWYLGINLMWYLF